MFCKNCGNQLDGTTAVCPKCGTPVDNGQVTPIATPVVNPNQNMGAMPVVDPSQNMGTVPVVDPSQNMGTMLGSVPNQNMGAVPVVDPSQNMGTVPVVAPNQNMGTMPGSVPNQNMGAVPVVDPSQNMGAVPGSVPNQNMGAVPGANPVMNGGVPNNAQGNGKKSKTTIILAAVLVIVVVAGVLGVMLLNKGDSAQEKTTDKDSKVSEESSNKTVQYLGYNFSIPDKYQYSIDNYYGLLVHDDESGCSIGVDTTYSYDEYRTRITNTKLFMEFNSREYIATRLTDSKNNNLIVYITAGFNDDLFAGFLVRRDGTYPGDNEFSLVNEIFAATKALDSFAPSDDDPPTIDVTSLETMTPPEFGTQF